MKNLFLNVALAAAITLTFSNCTPGHIVVRTRPQAPVYVRPVAPSPSYVWVDGDWIRRGNQYVYRQGYWAAPRRRRTIYAPGHWQTRRHGDHWVSGHWR